MKAIETHYAGCRFRSRLEARWAVFFDHMGIRWDYEPEGFEAYGQRYLPDFRLPELDTWVEVKGSTAALTPETQEQLSAMVDYKGPVSNGLLLLGPVPDATNAALVTHQQLYHDKGVYIRNMIFTWDSKLEFQNLPHLLPSDFVGSSHPFLPEETSVEAAVFHITATHEGRTWPLVLPDKILAAYRAARQARFEYGESG